jgi:hypothetical protein
VSQIKEKEKSSAMKQNQSLERRDGGSAGITMWSIVGGAALLLVAAAVVVSLPDIKRYIKISRM